PVRVECSEPSAAPCRDVAAGLRRDGVLAGLAAPGASTGPDTLRVLVGLWPSLRIEPAAGQLERGPRASGVYARPAADGRAIAALDPRGRVAKTLGAGLNPFVASANGLTVVVRLGPVPILPDDITLEAIAYGGVLGLRALVLVVACSLGALCVDPDAVLALFRRRSLRSALTAALA